MDMTDMSALDLGKEVRAVERGGGSLKDYFLDLFRDAGWFEDSWADTGTLQDDWWDDYWGQDILNIADTWSDEDMGMLRELRDVELSDFRSQFVPSEQKIGQTGFANVSNIGEFGNLGGADDWRSDYAKGVEPIETDFAWGQEDLWTQYGQGYMDMFASLSSSGAWGDTKPDV
tara:strand:+ start:526 stop:1044 length:519 start_codon:yes stop_codon:yes gene_type:complete